MFKLVLGLEIHIHVKTSLKMFCGCDANIYNAEPNTHTCPVCLGLPGALPVPNAEAVEKTQLLGMALNSKLNENSRFDRKHYFYPDLPKGYQISQYKQPLCEGGYLELESGKKIEIERIHLEEDTAKSFHEGNFTLIDFNMSGMPLVELVTKPVFESAADAGEFGRKLRDLVRLIGISDADLEKGQMRIEPNISVRTVEMAEKQELPDYKVEVKNINSFKFMERAVEYEFERQKNLLEKGEKVLQENRGWNENSNQTVSQREKEEAHDYRYFPEPDVPPMFFDEDYIKELSAKLPELPHQLKTRLKTQYGLNENNAKLLSENPGISLLNNFEEVAQNTNIEPNKVANLLLNKPEFRNIEVEKFEQLVKESEEKVEDDSVLENAVAEVLSENTSAVEDFKNGKESALQYLLGQVMRKTKGKADPQKSLEIIKKSL